MPEAREDRAVAELVAHLGQSAEEAYSSPRVLSPVEDLPRERLGRHRLTSMAYHAGYQEFRDDYIRNALLAELREAVLAEALSAFADAGIRVVLLKGISYVGVIYDDAATRPMGDIDLMVQAARHRDATSVLERLGYRTSLKKVQRSQTHHAVTLSRHDGATIDLHRSITQPLRSQIDLEQVWARALPAIEREDRCERLDPVDEACFHLVHIARHELMVPAVCYIEARRLVARRGVTWQEVYQRARDFRLSRAVGAAWAMSEALADPGSLVRWPDRSCFVLPEPAEVLRYQPVERRRQIVRKAALVEGPRELAGLFAVAIYERWGRR